MSFTDFLAQQKQKYADRCTSIENRDDYIAFCKWNMHCLRAWSPLVVIRRMVECRGPDIFSGRPLMRVRPYSAELARQLDAYAFTSTPRGVGIAFSGPDGKVYAGGSYRHVKDPWEMAIGQWRAVLRAIEIPMDTVEAIHKVEEIGSKRWQDAVDPGRHSLGEMNQILDAFPPFDILSTRNRCCAHTLPADPYSHSRCPECNRHLWDSVFPWSSRWAVVCAIKDHQDVLDRQEAKAEAKFAATVADHAEAT